MQKKEKTSDQVARDARGDRKVREGRRTETHDASAWRKELGRIKEMFPELQNARYGESGYNPLYARGIEESFPQEKIKADTQLSIFHVEPLLEFASQILERVVSGREQWNALGRNSIDRDLELVEFFDLDEIHKDAVKAGLYTLPFERSTAESNALHLDRLAHVKAAEKRLALVKLYAKLKSDWHTSAKRTRFVNMRRVLAFISGKFLDKDSDQGRLRYAEYPYEGSRQRVSDIKSGAESWLANRDAELSSGEADARELEGEVQQIISDTAGHSTGWRETGINLQREYDEKNIDLQKRQMTVRRQLAQRKSSELGRENGPYNFLQQMEFVKDRVWGDFKQASAALTAVAQGMEAIYNYKSNFPLGGKGGLPAAGDIDRAVLWSNEAMAFLTRFARHDQNYVFPVSLRGRLGEKDWKAGLESGNFSILLAPQDFDGQAFVRLRGVSAHVVHSQQERSKGDLWGLQVNAPETSVMYYDGKAGSSLDQRALPKLFLARVAEREAHQHTDVVGVRAYYNVSPIGDPGAARDKASWKLRVSQKSLMGRPRQLLEDLQLDLHLAVKFV